MTAPRIVDQPVPGCFEVRLGKNFPRVPAEIRYAATIDPETGEPGDRSPLYQAMVCGEPWGDASPLPTVEVWRIWEGGRPIDRADHDLRCQQAAWDRTYAPGSPLANPFRPVDLAAIEPGSLF